MFNKLILSSIGYDELLSRDEQKSVNKYPPYNIIKVDSTTYIVEVAVSGFVNEELSIVEEKQLLTIKGVPKEADDIDPTNYLHKGIAKRKFELKLQLDNYIEVESASYNHGLLTITLKKNEPIELQPRKITIL